MTVFCKDCKHIRLAKTPDPAMHLAECALTEIEHPVTGIKRGKNCFDERITELRENSCGKEGRNFEPRLAVA